MKRKHMRYWFWWPARTLDPYEADTPAVMQVARNIYAPLVSSFLDGKTEGMIAESWKISEDGKLWKFKIRKGLKFEDGSKITPDIVLQNFRRILWLTRDEGLILNSLIPEIKMLKSFNQPLKSLYVDGDEVIFQFNRRPIDLFEAISQPIYGIANPLCFDEQGKWKDPFCSSASGQYQVVSHDDNKILLKSRKIFPETQEAPEFVEIHSPKTVDDNVVRALIEDRGDLTVEHSFAVSKKTIHEIEQLGIKMVNEPPVRMHFVHINHQKSYFSNLEVRQNIRENFLNTLGSDSRYLSSSAGLDLSFIPKGGVGYKKFSIVRAPKVQKMNQIKVDVLIYPFAADINIQQSVEDALIGALKRVGFHPNVIRYSDRYEAFNRMRKGDFDVIVRGTGILPHNPYADLRMMFMSKVGALIPDPSGNIPKIIEAAESEELPNKRAEKIEKINTQIFNDAAVVTFAHSHLVYVHRKEVNLDRLNLFVDPIEFRAVGWK